MYDEVHKNSERGAKKKKKKKKNGEVDWFSARTQSFNGKLLDFGFD